MSHNKQLTDQHSNPIQAQSFDDNQHVNRQSFQPGEDDDSETQEQFEIDQGIKEEQHSYRDHHIKRRQISYTNQQPTPTGQQSSNIENMNDKFYKIMLQNQLNNIQFDDPRIARLESSPYRQKLYYKNKNKNFRTPSIIQGQNLIVNQNVKFPPTEFFNNLKATQMRHTHNNGFSTIEGGKQQLNLRSNSIIPHRVKVLNTQVPPPYLTEVTSSGFFPPSLQGQKSALPQSVQTSNNDLIGEQINNSDYQHSTITSRGIRFYNRVVSDFENKFYQNKTRPSSIKKRTEQIYDENIQLKHQINQVTEHLTIQTTQNKLLNNELDKQKQAMNQIFGRDIKNKEGYAVVLEDTSIKQTELVFNLKRELDKALKDLSDKDNEIKTIQKQSKVTKYKELEVECKMYMNECFRLHRLLKKFLLKTGLSNQYNNSQQDLNDGPSDIMEQLNFLKNQNFKLKQEVAVSNQRYEIQSHYVKTIKEQNQQFYDDIENMKQFNFVQAIQQKTLKTVKDEGNTKQFEQEINKLIQDIIQLKHQNEELIQEKLSFKKAMNQQNLNHQLEIQLFKRQQSELEQKLKNVIFQEVSDLQQQAENVEKHKFIDDQKKEETQQVLFLTIKIQELQDQLNDQRSATDSYLQQNVQKYEQTIHNLNLQIQESQQVLNKLLINKDDIKTQYDADLQQKQEQIQLLTDQKQFQSNQESIQLMINLQLLQADLDGYKVSNQQKQEENDQLSQEVEELRVQINNPKLEINTLTKADIKCEPSSIHQQSQNDSIADNLQAQAEDVFNEEITETDYKLQHSITEHKIDAQTFKQVGQEVSSNISTHRPVNIAINEQLENQSNNSNGLKYQVLLKPVSDHELKSKINKKAYSDEENEHYSNNSDQTLIVARSLVNSADVLKQIISDLNLQIKDNQDKLAELSEQNHASNEIIEDLMQKIESKDQRIDNLNSLIQASDNEITNINKLVQKNDKKIPDLLQQIEQQQQSLSDLKNEIDSKEEQLIQVQFQYTKLQSQLDNSLREIQKQTKQIIDLKLTIENQDQAQSNQDEDLIQKLEDLMLSLKEKDQTMQYHISEITHLKESIESKQIEFLELENQLNLKDSEITTIKEYFDKSESQIESLRKDATIQKKDLESITTKLEVFNNEKVLSQSKEKDIEAYKKEIIILNQALSKERQQYLIDIQSRFHRCLEILQISDIKSLTNFLKSGDSDKTSEQDLEEYLAMKFNMTKSESSLFLKRVLCLSGAFSKNEMIERFIQKVGKDVEVIDQKKVDNAYKELAILVIKQYSSVDKFLQHNNFDKSKIMHYYLVEKIVSQQLKNHKSARTLQHMIITHLLNQSRNFYQIESRVLKDNLLKQQANAIKEISQLKEQSSWGDKEKQEESEYGEESVNEEEKNIQKEDKIQGLTTFNKALNLLKQSSVEIGDASVVLNSKQLFTTHGSESPDNSKQGIKTSNEQNIQLLNLSKFLTKKKINLRQFLKIYHAGRAEIAFCDHEIEVLSFDEFVFFVNQQNVYSEGDLEEYKQFNTNPLEELLENMLDSMQCMHVVQSTNVRIIEFPKFIENLEGCGYQDYQWPRQKKNFNFKILDVKSIRILNRLTQFIYNIIEKFIHSNNITEQLSKDQSRILLEHLMENTFKGTIKKVIVLNQNKQQTVHLISQEDFFLKLMQLGVRKEQNQYVNLRNFLRIDMQYQDLILFKKLVKTIEIFNMNNRFTSIGTKVTFQQQQMQRVILPSTQSVTQAKVKYQEEKQPTEESYEYGYEDEQESPISQKGTKFQFIPPQSKSNQQQSMPMHQLMFATPPHPIPHNKEIINEQLQAKNEESEYYEEEY